MGLLSKVGQLRDVQFEKKRAAGLLARTILYRKSMEDPGLLRRAEYFLAERKEIPAEAAPKGLLEKAVIYSGGGLLEKAASFASKSETSEEEGLLARATRYGERAIPRGVRVARIGLLKRALLFIAEAEKAGRTEEEIPSPAAATVEAPELSLEEMMPAAQEIAPSAEVAMPSIEEMETAVAEEEAPPAEEITPSVEEKVPQAGEEIITSRSELFKQYLEEKAPLKLLRMFAEIIANEGYDSFYTEILETFMLLGKGKTGMLVTAHKDEYRAEIFLRSGKSGSSVEDLDTGKKEKIGVKQNSKFALYLAGKSGQLIRMTGIKDESVIEGAPFKSHEPWTILPLILGDFLAGFVLIGNQPKRPRIQKENLLLFAQLSTFYVCTSVLESNFQESVNKLLSEKDDLVSLLELYNFSAISEVNFSEVLQRIAEKSVIESAVVAAGWDSKGPITIYGGVGISEKGLKRYRISKSDGEIKSIIMGREPAVPGDLEKRLAKFLKEDRRSINTFIVVPVVFSGQTLGAIIIHKMKGVMKRLSPRVKTKLKHIAQSVVPFLLYRKMTGLEPLSVFESLLEREAAKAKKDKSPLHIISFTVRNYKTVIKSQGYRKYRQLLDKFHAIIRKRVREDGVVHTVSLNKVVLLLTHRERKKVSAIIRDVKSSISALIKKEKAELPLTFSPLRTTYPNESKSVAEILRLIG